VLFHAWDSGAARFKKLSVEEMNTWEEGRFQAAVEAGGQRAESELMVMNADGKSVRDLIGCRSLTFIRSQTQTFPSLLQVTKLQNPRLVFPTSLQTPDVL